MRLRPEHAEPFGHDTGKVHLDALREPRQDAPDARLVLVSAITPTPAGEGKTTTSIGLADGLSSLGEDVCLTLREPSLGPIMGIKGGGTGGGRSRLHPAERIDLHFTGDLHAVGVAHNLLAAMVDQHLHFGNALDIDPRRIVWKRVLDVHDRALRSIVCGLGGRKHGVPREAGFDVTAASEIMAVLCLAESIADLAERLDRIVVAYDRVGQVVRAEALGVTGALVTLLTDALRPNLVQTLEGTPAFVHGGPFANIAHGCNSVLATKMALHHARWCVTEAGFGFDLGGEKFLDIKCRSAGMRVNLVVLVASVRALKHHGGVKRAELARADAAAVERGLPNLARHLESVRVFGLPAVVAINRFDGDTVEEMDVVRRFCDGLGVACAVAEHHARGPEGAEELARLVIEGAPAQPPPLKPLYELEAAPEEKLRAVATRIYGARDVRFTPLAERRLARLAADGFGRLPVCVAKTPLSLSDDPSVRGRPEDFLLTVRDVELAAGAGFIVALTGDLMRMPGLPRRPRAELFDVDTGAVRPSAEPGGGDSP